MGTFLEHGGPVNLEDCLFRIFVFLRVAHLGGTNEVAIEFKVSLVPNNGLGSGERGVRKVDDQRGKVGYRIGEKLAKCECR